MFLRTYKQMVDMGIISYNDKDNGQKTFELKCDICDKKDEGEDIELVERGWNFSFAEINDGSLISFAVCGEESEEDLMKEHKKYKKRIDEIIKSD